MVTQKQVVTSFDSQHFYACRKGMSAATAGGAVCCLEPSRTRTVPYVQHNVPYRTRKMMYRTVLQRNVLYRTLRYSIVLYLSVPYFTVPYRTVLCRTVEQEVLGSIPPADSVYYYA